MRSARITHPASGVEGRIKGSRVVGSKFAKTSE